MDRNLSRTIRLLQVGDLHLPDWPDAETPVDVKDASFSARIKRDVSHQPLRAVLRRFNEISTSGLIDAIICMGDYTSRGQTELITKAVQIIDGLSADGFMERAPRKLGVPGNHDVSRTEAVNYGPTGKFIRIEEAFRKFGWEAPPNDDCASYDIGKPNGPKMSVHLLNSSLGSWSTHLLPTPLAEALSETSLKEAPINLFGEGDASADIEALDDSASFSDRQEQVYYQLDTPYISDRTLMTLKQRATSSSSEVMLIASHHNILPQAIPRISHYAEMLNSGQVRRFFQNIRKTVVYLHGHIHEDPVERISLPTSESDREEFGEIISISAPVIWEGFNEVCFFLDDLGEAFLIRITEYRLDKLGHMGNFSDQVSRYIPLQNRVEHLVTPEVQKVWGSIRDKKTVSWSELLGIAKAQSLCEEKLEHALLSLFCCSLVKIGQLGRERTRWRIHINLREA